MGIFFFWEGLFYRLVENESGRSDIRPTCKDSMSDPGIVLTTISEEVNPIADKHALIATQKDWSRFWGFHIANSRYIWRIFHMRYLALLGVTRSSCLLHHETSAKRQQLLIGYFSFEVIWSRLLRVYWMGIRGWRMPDARSYWEMPTIVKLTNSHPEISRAISHEVGGR